MIMHIQQNKEEYAKKNIKTISDYVCNHFGFTLIDSPAVSYTSTEEKLVTAERERIAYYYKKNGLEKRKNPPKFYFYNKPILNPKKNLKASSLGLDIYNVEDSIAEGILLTTIFNILKEENIEDFIFEINTMGDKESLKKFQKELIAHYKQKENFDQFTHVEKSKLPKDPISLLSSKKDFMVAINEEAPRPINFLSEKSRDFFGSIIEYLDAINVPYRINDSLFDIDNTFSDFMFRVVKDQASAPPQVLALGGRYSELSKKESGKKTTIATGASLFIKQTKAKIKLSPAKIKFNLLKISEGSKKNFLSVIQDFLALRYPISFYPLEEKTTAQLELARTDAADYSIIFGQKEFLEKNLLIRKMNDKSQITVLQKNLQETLKKEYGI